MAQKHLELEAKRLPCSEIKTYFEKMLKDSKWVLPKGVNAYHCKVVKPVALQGELNDTISSQIKDMWQIEELKKLLLTCSWGEVKLFMDTILKVNFIEIWHI